MGEIIINTTLQQRSDNAARWTEVNPVLLRGELGIEIDTGKLKVGDGNSSWADLPYLSAGISRREILDMVYPNDIVCITVTDTSPEAVLGGTWEEISAEGLEMSEQPLHSSLKSSAKKASPMGWARLYGREEQFATCSPTKKYRVRSYAENLYEGRCSV